MSRYTSSNADMSCSALEELMLSRGSMTLILSRDLFCVYSLAGGGAANAGVRFLGLAVGVTGAQLRHRRDASLHDAPDSFRTGPRYSS
jgi:hypothetical protein